ncbi:MAG: carotenoid oxygenase family protein [Thermosynechococcaceae cyanobacterium]
MTTASQTRPNQAQSKPSNSQQADWGRAFSGPIRDFPLTPLTVVSGALPPDIRGSLYRNGPALFERQGERIAHWFDGDGAVLGVHFNGTGATGVYRMVQTAGYQAEAATGQFKFGSYGRRPSGPFWQSSTRQPKNSANTSVLATSDRLLALWEGGHPYALDLQTLDTLALDDLQGLEPGQPFSAHPKVDPITGESYNFGVSFGRKTQLHLYRCDRQGQVRQKGTIPLDIAPLIHDFAMAGPYLIFCISPVHLNPLPLLLRWQSYSEALHWHAEHPTQILVVDRDTLQLVGQGEADPWFQWHFGNGFVDRDGQVALNLVRYPDFQTNQFLRDVPSGQPQTVALGTLWQLRINPQTATVTEALQLSDRTCEFPTVNPTQVGQATRYTYLSTRSDAAQATDLFDAIAGFDHNSGELTVADLGQHRYPSEPIFAPHPQNPEQGWILTVVYDSDRHCSEVWIFDGPALQSEPICRLALPEVVPFGFHGTWKMRQNAG